MVFQSDAVPPIHRNTGFSSNLTETQLLLLDSGKYTDQSQDGRNENGPQLNVQHKKVVARLRGGSHGGQRQHEDEVAGHAVIFVNLLCAVDTAPEAGGEVLREANNGLDDDQDVSDDAENGMGGLKMVEAAAGLVDLNDNQASDEGDDAQLVEAKVDVGTMALLLSRVRGLQDQDALSEEQDAGGIEKLLAKSAQRFHQIRQSFDGVGRYARDGPRRVSDRGRRWRTTRLR